MIVVYLPGAMRDIRGIRAWYATERPEGEARFSARLREAVGRITREPESFPWLLRRVGLRKARVLRSPYSVAFFILPTEPPEVRLVAVIHGKRHPGFWMRRMGEQPPK